MCISTDIK